MEVMPKTFYGSMRGELFREVSQFRDKSDAKTSTELFDLSQWEFKDCYDPRESMRRALRDLVKEHEVRIVIIGGEKKYYKPS